MVVVGCGILVLNGFLSLDRGEEGDLDKFFFILVVVFVLFFECFLCDVGIMWDDLFFFIGIFGGWRFDVFLFRFLGGNGGLLYFFFFLRIGDERLFVGGKVYVSIVDFFFGGGMFGGFLLDLIFFWGLLGLV